MIGEYNVAHVLGLTRNHEPIFREIERELTKQGFIVFCPAIYEYEVYKEYAVLLDNMCYEKLKICDICVLATPEHVGVSTKKRVKQAFDLHKPVYVWNRRDLKLGSVLDMNSLQVLIDVSVPYPKK